MISEFERLIRNLLSETSLYLFNNVKGGFYQIMTSYWADRYVEKKKKVEDAIGMIRSGQRVFIGSSCGEPQYLVKQLAHSYGKNNEYRNCATFRH